MDPVRFGIIGFGNMGSHHASSMTAGLIPGASLAAICDINPEQLEKARGLYPAAGMFTTHRELLASNTCDAIIIATPHYDHPPIALDAFAAGVHVLSEKPAAVSVNAARKLNAEYEAKYKEKVKFGIMFQQRAYQIWKKLRDVLASGEVGEIRRFTWVVTDWFRTWTYYASGGWRATWAGEGGGVLINQCPHNLDLIQWFMGGMMPTRVTAVAHIAKTHPIEVEDEVSAIMEYPNGATAHFVTTTGEAPGSNRLEIAGDRGKIVAENGKLTFHRTLENVKEFREKSPKLFPVMETWTCDIPVPPDPGKHHEQVVAAFVKSVQEGTPLVADGVEGVRGLELGNAMLMSGLSRQPVDLPMDGGKFDAFIEDLKKRYGGKKTVQAIGEIDRSMGFKGF
jgi:predicted dehydrogenase